MPYIEDDVKFELLDRMAETPGELNFVITAIIIGYITKNGLSYQNINDVLGALDGASKEFYRRVAVPYENFKADVNGDVYSPLTAGPTELDDDWAARLK